MNKYEIKLSLDLGTKKKQSVLWQIVWGRIFDIYQLRVPVWCWTLLSIHWAFGPVSLTKEKVLISETSICLSWISSHKFCFSEFPVHLSSRATHHFFLTFALPCAYLPEEYGFSSMYDIRTLFTCRRGMNNN